MVSEFFLFFCQIELFRLSTILQTQFLPPLSTNSIKETKKKKIRKPAKSETTPRSCPRRHSFSFLLISTTITTRRDRPSKPDPSHCHPITVAVGNTPKQPQNHCDFHLSITCNPPLFTSLHHHQSIHHNQALLSRPSRCLPQAVHRKQKAMSGRDFNSIFQSIHNDL